MGVRLCQAFPPSSRKLDRYSIKAEFKKLYQNKWVTGWEKMFNIDILSIC
jgi:hypothetical protein